MGKSTSPFQKGKGAKPEKPCPFDADDSRRQGQPLPSPSSSSSKRVISSQIAASISPCVS